VGVTEGEMRDTFSQVGHVVELRFLRSDGNSECAALVRMASKEQAEAARSKLDGTFPVVMRSPISVKHQMKSGSELKDHVYVRNIPLNTPEEKIQELMKPYGTVKWCSVLGGGPAGLLLERSSHTAVGAQRPG